MKTNQDGGSVTASDPAAAGKQLAADQEGAAKSKGPAQRQPINNQKANRKGKDMVPEKFLKRGDVRADGSIVGETKNTQKPTKREKKLTEQKRKKKTDNSNKTRQGDRKPKDKIKPDPISGVPDSVGPSRMGYAQKFGPGRANGYDAGARKVMDVMTFGAGKYMAEGPGQSYSVGEPDRSGEGEYSRRQRGVFASGDRAMAGGSPVYRHSGAVNGNLPQSQIEKRGPCGGPGQRPCGSNELSAAERKVVNDGDMNNYLSLQVSNATPGSRMDAKLTQNRARQRSADSSYVVSRARRDLLTFKRDFNNTSQGGRPGGRQKGNVIGRYNPIDPDTGRITSNRKALDPNTGSMTMTKSKVNKKRKKA